MVRRGYKRGHKGATPKLTQDVLACLPDLLSEGATEYGFRGDLWTCERVAQVIAWELGVSYHKDHVSRLLKTLDWTPQKPAKQDSRRNEVTIAHWRAEVWPALKKRRDASGA
jgi:transposase